MSKLDEYTARAAESLAAVGTAANDRDRAHHQRAHAIWRRLIATVAADKERAAAAPAGKIKPLKQAVAPPPAWSRSLRV